MSDLKSLGNRGKGSKSKKVGRRGEAAGTGQGRPGKSSTWVALFSQARKPIIFEFLLRDLSEKLQLGMTVTTFKNAVHE